MYVLTIMVLEVNPERNFVRDGLLEARRRLFPDWPWLCDESSAHQRVLHIPVHCSDYGGKIQDGVPDANNESYKSIPYSTYLLCKFGRICATGNAFVRLIIPSEKCIFTLVAEASEERLVGP